MLKNNKGFTVIELIMSFLFASILALSLFSIIILYRSRQTDASIESDLLAFKSTLLMDIQNDIQLRGLKQMDNCPPTQEDINDGKRIHERCVSILFNDDVVKTFEIKGELKIDKIKNNDGTIAEFSYRIPYIVYGDIRYDIPDAANVYVDDDYILYTSSVYDGLETGTKLYKVNFDLKHGSLDTNINISLVANVTAPVPSQNTLYRQYNIGDQVTVQVKDNTLLKFRVIKNSNKYTRELTLLYDDQYNSSAHMSIPSSIAFNSLGANSNNYDGSLIKERIQTLAQSMNYVDEVRLITTDEIARIVPFCPKYRGIDSADLSLTSAPAWLTNTSFWTMSEKRVTGSNSGKKVWYINSSSKTLTSDLVNATHALRPVIVVKKDYVLV